MKTKIIKINPEKPETSKIRIVAETLRKGGLVAFPTETVYGLGADALNPEAIKKIFEVKGRPKDNPLIVHIANKKEVYKLTKEIPKEAKRLIDKFWPGPLTIIMKKSDIVSGIVTAGLDSVAIRMPDNKIALTLIKKTKDPIVAPSANLSGKPSPTIARDVIQDLYGKIDVIIDGGETDIGVESTVLDLTTNPPTLLRPGGIILEELKKILGKINVSPVARGKRAKELTTKSPGMKYNHYSPNAHIILVEGKYQGVKRKVQERVDEYKKERKKVAIMTTNKNHTYETDIVKFMGSNLNTMAKNLFKSFREFDRKEVDIIVVEGVEDKDLGLAIMNRLRKASYKIIYV